jgi:putative two-component system response regulator
MLSAATILVIDDEPSLLEVFRDLLSYRTDVQYKVITANNGQEGYKAAIKELPDLIITDITMPEIDGITLCKLLKEKPETTDIPVVMVTGLDDNDLKIQGLIAGASDFLNKPFLPEEMITRIRNLLKMKEMTDHLKNEAHTLEEKVREKTLQIEASFKELQTANILIKHAYLEAITRLTMAAEYKDDETGTHIRRMGYYAKLLAEFLGFSAIDCDNLFHAAPMHDIGKIGIPDHILLKPAGLTPVEFDIIKRHTIIGAKILSESQSDILRTGEMIALSHHERWDGTGYPRGLKGEAIPVFGRIIFICDVYDALRSKRPYKPAYSHEDSCEKIMKGDSKMQPGYFDPAILDLFSRNHEKFREIFDSALAPGARS